MSFVSCPSRNVSIWFKWLNLQHFCVMLLMSVWSVERSPLSFLMFVICVFFFFVSLDFIKFIVLFKELVLVSGGGFGEFFCFFLFLFIYLFVCGCIGSLLLHRLSLVAASRGYSSLRYAGFSLR